VKCAIGVTEDIKVHQLSVLSPFLFAIVMERVTDEIQQEWPWTRMLADDIVICNENR
jgi:hypothetical protein